MGGRKQAREREGITQVETEKILAVKSAGRIL